MILINLLPPEMRKKQGAANPLAYAIAACYLVALIPVGTWVWLKYSRLPNAESVLAERNSELEQKTTEAAAVEALEAQIVQFEAHRDTIVGLLARKVYWARAFDEFVNHLNAPAGTPWQGFEVSCTQLTIQPAPVRDKAGKKEDSVAVGFQGRYKLVGLERDKAGDYVRDFFLTTEASKFWSGMGFVGKPELTYRGDTPDWKSPINRVAVEFTLDWVRVKSIATGKSQRSM
jgi:hypothetical protein